MIYVYYFIDVISLEMMTHHKMFAVQALLPYAIFSIFILSITSHVHYSKVNKRLGNAKKFLQHKGNGFRSWQLTFEKQIPLLLYGFRLNSTISIKFQFFRQKSLIVCLQWLNSSNHCNIPSG